MFKLNNTQNPKRLGSRSVLLLIFNSLLILSLACSLPNLLQGGKETPAPGSTAAPSPSAPTPTPQPLPPALVESDPPIGGELPLKGPLTLYFNQPMERASVEAALAKQASLLGNLTWVDDSTLVLDPGKPLEPESLLSLNIGTSARSASGLALTQPISLTYQTAGFLRLSQALPEPDSDNVDPTSAVVASFNRPVVALGGDSADMPAAFTLEPAAEGLGEWLNTSTYIFYPDPGLEGGKTYTVQMNPDLQSTDGSPLDAADSWSFSTAVPRLVSVQPSMQGMPARLDAEVILTFNQPMDTASVEANFQLVDPAAAPVPGKITWSEENTVLTFKPDNLLARSTVYRGALDGQAQAMGGTTLEETTTFEIQTVPDLAVLSSDPPQGGQKPPYNAVTLRFSGPIIDKGIQDSVTISPTVTNQGTYWDEGQLTLSIYGDFVASSNYSLSLSPDIADPWGGTLGQPYTLNFSTAPLDPQFILTTGTDILFLTPQDSSMVIQVTNLSSIPLSLGRVPLEDFMTMISPSGYELRNSFHAPDEVSWEQTLQVEANRSQAVNLFISPDQQPLVPGIYYLRFNFTQPNLYPATYLLVVSNIQSTFKLSATDTLVWAVDLPTKSPVQGANITLYDENGNQMATGQTDAEGIFATSVPARENPYSVAYAVIGQPGEASFGLALSSWTMGVNPYDFGLLSDLRPPRRQAYLYTDRPIYRPGQTVYFRGVVRQAYNGRYRLPDTNSVQLKLYGPFGTEMETIDLGLSALGTGHGQYILANDAQPGYYTLSMVDSDWDSSVSFQVADYRKPEINVQVDLGDSEQVQSGDMLSATVNARYFFDAPAGNVPVKWALYAARSFFDLPDYQVGAQDTRWLDAYQFPIFGDSLGTQVATGEGTTDAQGLLTIEVPTVFDQEQFGYDTTQRQKLTLEVTLQDESGLPVSARDEVQVNPTEYYIGLRPDAWVGQAGQQSSFAIQVVDWDKNPAGVRSLHAEYQKVVWVRQDPEGPYMMPTYEPQYTPAGSTDFTTNDQGQARIAFTPEEPGTYQIDVTGDGALTQFILWVGGPGQAVWPNLPNQRLRLAPDQQGYQPGDTAQVFVPNPFGASVQALVTTERSVVLSHQLVTLDPDGTTLSFPLTSDDAPNVYVSVTLLGQTSDGRPDFRQGYVELPVEPVEQTLNVQLTSEPQRAGPGDEVSFDVQVTDAAGQPVEGEFSLAVVDLAALALADPNSKDIVPAFYDKQPLGVQTGLSLAAYANRQANLPVGGGGGGGEEFLLVAREDFPDTAYWNAEITTGPDGTAHVSVQLPDTLTTWKVDLRGLTADTRVGQAESEVVTSKDLLVRPVTPRFLVVDDHAQLAAIVQNNTQDPLEAEVALQAIGVNLDDPSTAAQMVSVPAGGRARVEWWGAVQDVESAELVFSATAGDLQDITRPASGALPVLHYTAPQTFATTGVMDEGDERLELVSLPRSFDPRGGSLNVELAPSLATAMLNALDALEHFPYECTEQTISRFLPNLETYRVLQEFGIDSPELKARLERTLDEGLQSLLSRQNTMDGGWGWWKGSESDPYVSAYVLFGLVRAREAGSSVSQDVIQRGLDYLRSTMTSPASLDETWQLDRLAFENFVLAQAAEAGFGAADASAAEALYERRDELNPWAQAYLALTFESLSPGSEQAKTLISDLESTAVRTATGAHWEEKEPSLQNMTTPISNSAIVLYALAQRDPGTPLLAETVRYLMSNRRGEGAWASTFSTAWSLMGLSEVIRGTGELGGDFNFSASVNGAPVANGQASQGGAGISPPVMASVPLSSLYPDDPNALVIRREPGTGRLYYMADLRVNRPVETVAPLNRGISITRATYPTGEACTAENCPAIQSAQSGDRVKVRVTLTIPNDSYYLLVEDYIPAGAEILDTSLKTSQLGELMPPEQEEPEPLYNPRRPFEEGWGWWLFKDPQIYDDHIAWAVDYLPAGTYELTYTLTIVQPGEYRVLPARAWQFYFPEVQGTSAGEVFGIEP